MNFANVLHADGIPERFFETDDFFQIRSADNMKNTQNYPVVRDKILNPKPTPLNLFSNILSKGNS